MEVELAPVIIFCFKRLEHLRKVIEALSKNTLINQTDVYIYSDSPRAAIDNDGVSEVRQYLTRLKENHNFKSLRVEEAIQNKGLSKSIIEGIDYVINKHEKAIVLEDDIIISTDFLCYMNESLNFYRDDFRVWQISSHLYPVSNANEMKLIPFSNCWGWATWKDRWKYFRKDDSLYAKLAENSKTRWKFTNYNYTKGYFDQVHSNYYGKIDTWAIYWYSTVFFHHGLTLYPASPKSVNIGMDGSGENSRYDDSRLNPTSIESVGSLEEFNYPCEVDVEYYFDILTFLKSQDPSIISRVLSRLSRLVKLN